MPQTIDFEPEASASDGVDFEPDLKIDFEPETQAAPFQGLRRRGLESIGQTLKGVGAVSEMPAPRVYTPTGEAAAKPLPKGRFMRGGVYLADPTESARETMGNIQRNPLYVAGQSLVDVAPETFPLTPAQEQSKWTKAGEMVGGMVPAVTGPAAPLAMGAESIGEHISSDYERMKQAALANGISPETADELASKGAIDKAFTSGVIQTGIFAVMPPVLRGALEKYLVDKFGKAWLSRYLTGRLAAGTEGAAVGASSQAGENIVEAEPVLQGTGQSAQGLALMNLLLPWLKGKPDAMQAFLEKHRQGQPETKAPVPETTPPKTEPPADVNQAVLDDLLQSLTKGQIVRAKPPTEAPKEPVTTPVTKVDFEPVPKPFIPAERPAQYTILDAVKEHGGLGGPDLADALRQMAEGKTAAQVAEQFGGEYDQLADVLEQIQVAKGAERKRLARAYEQAGFGGGRGGIDETLLSMEQSQHEGLGLPNPPASPEEFIQQAFEAAKAKTASRADLPQDAEGKADLFWKAATSPESKVGLTKVDVGQLQVGQKFRLRGQGLSHEELEVIRKEQDPNSPDTDPKWIVTIKDGPTFGVQDLPEGAEIYVKKEPSVLHEEPPLFGAPESVQEQKARLAREAEQKRKASQREELLRRQQKPLSGSTGDIGQKDMLGGGDLFSETTGYPATLDGVAADLYGKPYAELSADQQGNVQVTVEAENNPNLQGRQPDRAAAGRQLPDQGESPAGTVAPAETPSRTEELRKDLRRSRVGSPERSRAAAAVGREWAQLRKDAAQTILDAVQKAQPEANQRSAQVLAKVPRRPNGEMDLKALKQLPDADLEAVFNAEELRHMEADAKRQLNTIGQTIYPGAEGQVLSKMERLAAARQPRSIGAGLRQALEANRGSEAGFVRIPTREEFLSKLGEIPDQVYRLYQWLDDARQRLVNRYRRGGLYDLLSYSFDASNTRAKLAAKQAGNIVLHELNRAFGVKASRVKNERNAERELGLTFAIEAGGQRTELGRMRTALTGQELPAGASRLWKARALRALDFAQANWDRLQPVADLYKRITDAENDYENLHGVATLYRKGGYVFHAHDVDESFGVLSTGAVGSQAGAPGPFLKQRDYNTYADAIAGGKTPISLNAIDLLQKRVELGQRLVNYGEWMDGLGSVTDPISRETMVQATEIRTRADGQTYEATPPNYELIDFGGRHVALHKGYTGLFGDLTNKSVFEQGPLRQAVMQGIGLAKHSMLLFDTYHLGRLAFWNAVTRLGGPTSARGLTLLDNTTPEIQRMIDRGELPAKWGQDLLSAKQTLDRLIRQGLNVGSVGDNLHSDLLQKLPGLGGFNKWLFNSYQRGAMAEVALIEHARQEKMFPSDSPDQLARRVAKDVNTRFGNLQSQGWIKNKTFQDLARIIFLAPQWNESLIRAELGAIKQAGLAVPQSLAAGRFAMGGLARGIGTALLGIFVGNQLINYATRGKPTWENEEEGLGSKISAWIPDYVGGGPGFFLNPMSVPAEIINLLWRSTDRHGGDWAAAMRDFAAGRFSALSKGLYTFATGETPMGQRLKQGAANRLGGTLEQMSPTPISGGAIARSIKQKVTGEHQEKYPGEFQKSALQSFGVKTEQAPGPERRIRDLAVRFQRANNIPEQPPQEPSVYQELTAAARRQNTSDAQAAIEKVLQTAKNNGEPHTLRDIDDYYRNWARRRFTLNSQLEKRFFSGLTPAQQEVYQRAYADRAAVAQTVGQLLRERAAARPGASLPPGAN